MAQSTASRNIKIVSTQEYDDVVAAVSKYDEGLRNGDWNRITEAFHDDAIMYGWTGDTLSAGSYRNLEDYVKAFGAAPQSKARLDILGITPTSAVVRVDMEDAADGTSYTDFHTLLKRDGQWKVIAKVFHQYEA